MRFNVFAAILIGTAMFGQVNTVRLDDEAKDDKKVTVPEFKLDVMGGDCHKVDLSAKAQVDVDGPCCGINQPITVNGGVCGCEEDKPLSQRVKEAFCDKDSKCGVDCSWCQAKHDVAFNKRNDACKKHEDEAACTGDADNSCAFDADAKTCGAKSAEVLCNAHADEAACGGDATCSWSKKDGGKCNAKFN